MCNDYEQHIAWAEYCRMMESLALDIPTHQTELDLPQADDIRISEPAPIMRAAGGTIELTRMTFAFPPSGPKGRAGLQLPFRGTEFLQQQALPYPGIGVFRIHRKEVAKGEASLHAQWRLVHGDRRTVARWRRQQAANIRHADD